MNRFEILERLQELCYHPEDVFDNEEWSSMTLEQLRTIAAIFEDGGIEFINDVVEATYPTPPRQRRRGKAVDWSTNFYSKITNNR